MNQMDFIEKRKVHWNAVVNKWGRREGLGKYYHRRVLKIHQFLVPPGRKILELGCGFGDLLAGLKPAIGIGVDFSAGMIAQAKSKHADLTFICADASDLELHETFDIILLSDLINDLWDVQKVLATVSRHATPGTRIILNFYSRLWEMPLRLAQKLRLTKPTLMQNWLTPEDVLNLMNLADFEHIRHWTEFLLPVQVPLLSFFANRFLAKLWPFNWLALSHFMVARIKPGKKEGEQKRSVSIIVPARNEAGNIKEIFARTPEMGKWTELVFVEGHSRDDTHAAIQREIELQPQRRCQLLQQAGIGKGDAVRLGFEHASGDIFMILDADLTVPPEDLPRFYQALTSGQGELINSVRLVYPMEKQAMRYLNFLGNKFFSLAFSMLLGQPIKDTLCGTKVLSRENYLQIKKNRAYFGDFDPFGDFDLIFGAAKLNLKIIDLPIRYRERVYGQTNIQRWKHGWLLLKMVAVAASRIKFI
ncbi:MAG TPA: glycosyltransferase [Patescibacteria group bacterium]|nr:glycosyltransferase [Patescibacteria group bacterium]